MGSPSLSNSIRYLGKRYLDWRDSANLAVVGALGGNVSVPQARTFKSDSDTQNNGPELQKHIPAGAQLFQAKGCVACHADNGKSYDGIGPQLSVSNNAGNNYYIHQIVRNGLYPMPAYAAKDLGNGSAFRQRCRAIRFKYLYPFYPHRQNNIGFYANNVSFEQSAKTKTFGYVPLRIDCWLGGTLLH